MKGIQRSFPGSLKRELLIYEDRSYEEDILEGSVKKMQSLYRSKGFYLVKIDYELKEFLEKNEVALTFNINERNKVFINKISIKGNESIKTKNIKKIMNTKKTGIFSRGILKDDVIAKDMEAIAALYRQNGFTEAKVLEPEVILSEDRTEMEVVIAIAEGPKTTIDKIIIKGNIVYPTEEIIKAMKGKEGMPYVEALANDDKYNILALYSKKGHLYANVVMKRFFKEDKKLIELVYTITEDKPVNIGRIYLTGNLLTRDKVVYRELLFHSGEPYDYEKILKTQRRLYSLGIFGEVKIDPIEEPKRKGWR